MKFLSLPEQIIKKKSEIDFVFCVGDDTDNANMFQSLLRIQLEISQEEDENHISESSQVEQSTQDIISSENDTEPDEGDFITPNSPPSFSRLQYESIRMKKEVEVFSIHIGISKQSNSYAAYYLSGLKQLRRILRGFAEISTSTKNVEAS